ncbi:ZMAT1 protein, partial [Glaucidium brasilianum]|nr:ZMAT1 protein [Glaucidium brasilianum]
CLDDILDEATRKDLFTNTFCKVCEAVLQSESQRTSHYKGKKHAQKVRLYIQMHGEKNERQEHGKQKKTDCVSFQMDGSIVDRNKYCNLCSMCFTSPVVALYHYLGKIHAKKLRQLGDQALVPAPQPVSAGESSSSSDIRLKLNDPDKYCKLCCAPFNNPLMARQHYAGKKHRRNVARKKILEELGDKALPAESSTNGKQNLNKSIGVGYYMCSVCKVTLTSVEMYQAHVHGHKHRIKLCREKALANLKKKSKKTHDSFQNELTNYTEVQKARDLEPRMYLGKAEEAEFQDKNMEGRSDCGNVVSSNFKYEQGQCSSLFLETQSPTNTGENSLPGWTSACECALEKTPSCCYNKEYVKEEQTSEVATMRDESFSLLVAKSKDFYKLMLASASSYSKEQKFQIKHSEEEKCISEELKYKKAATKQKRKKNSEDTDFSQGNEKQKRIKVEIDMVNEEKSRPYKDKTLNENPAEKKRKKHKKKPNVKAILTNVKREEELLWDESVLGY